MYRVYLDETLIAEKDIIGLTDSAEFTISREFGVDNSEQILRDKVEFQLRFAGAGYSMLCKKRDLDYCEKIPIRIEYSCDGRWEIIFSGVIHQKDIEMNVFQCIASVNAIRDDSFSGYIRDYLDTDIGLYNTKTINCEDLVLVSNNYTMFNNPANMSSTKTITGFDVLEVLQYYLNYITNNSIQIVSNYLTGTPFLGPNYFDIYVARFAITTGYNMHNDTGTLNQTNPLLSFQKLFNELRKKVKLYMAIEYDDNGSPYLRIEKEQYFFDNSQKLSDISDLPIDTKENIDTSLFYNQINVGSQTYELQDDATPDYPQDMLTAWNDEKYTNCGGCSGEKEKVLDLLSGFIIDSNVIYEALQQSAGSDYSNDDEIFMFHYYVDVDTLERIALITNESVYGKNIYNAIFTNETVLDNWSTTQCSAKSRSAKNGFKVVAKNLQICGAETIVHDVLTDVLLQNNLQGIVSYDIKNNITTSNITGTNPYGIVFPYSPVVSDSTSYFTVPSNGNYSFGVNATFKGYGISGNPTPIVFLKDGSIKYIVKVSVYSDNTFGTLTQEQVSEVYADYTANSIQTKTITFNTTEMALSSGNTVLVKLMVELNGECEPLYSIFGIYVPDASFYLISDGDTCSDTEQSTSTLPFVLDFKYPICYSDFKKMKENKRGYIEIAGNRYWIRDIKYRPGKLSDLKLLGSQTLCKNC